MNDLAEAGPEWSGKLKNGLESDTYSGNRKVKLGKATGYPYSKNSVPALKTDIKSTEATCKRFKEGGSTKRLTLLTRLTYCPKVLLKRRPVKAL